MSALSVPPRLAFVVADDDDAPQVFLMPLPDGPPVVLNNISALIWMLAADGEEDVAGAVAAVVDMKPEEVRDDVDRYLADLVSRSLLATQND